MIDLIEHLPVSEMVVSCLLRFFRVSSATSVLFHLRMTLFTTIKQLFQADINDVFAKQKNLVY